jgi:predicted metal-binding membrane protein
VATLAVPAAARRGVVPAAVRRRVWRQPEWPWVVLVIAAWAALVSGVASGGAAMHGADAEGHVASAAGHALGALPPAVGWWALMVVAMMVPATIPVLRRISFDSMWHRRHRSPLLFLAAFAGVWTAFGAAALGAWTLAAMLGAGHAMHGAAATGAMLFVAANWQLAPQHRRCLKRCHRTLPLGARGRAADRACLRYGLFHARQCAGACWPLMLAMVPGHGLALMAALTGLTTWQRLARRPNRSRCAGALIALASVVMLAG